MNVSEYVIEYLKEFGITHYFGYQGTMISHFVDALYQSDGVFHHVSCNEQGAALAACGYSKTTGKVSVAYATSGPGMVNLLQGIADAYFDSAPVLFISGQINVYEYTNNKMLRQQAFQQVSATDIVKTLTKAAYYVDDADKIEDILNAALTEMQTGRKGPVLIDLPMNIQRTVLDKKTCTLNKSFTCIDNDSQNETNKASTTIISHLKKSRRPVLLLGNGIGKSAIERRRIRELVEQLKIPVVSSMLGRDLLTHDDPYNFGMIGYSYGHRYANLIVNAKADLIIAFGIRLCPRQIGMDSMSFATNAKLIRVDIDETELERNIHEDDIKIRLDVNCLIDDLLDQNIQINTLEWNKRCRIIKEELVQVDEGQSYRIPNLIIKKISELLPEACNVISDVGQHQIWTAQSHEVKEGQRLLFSGGHGAMGFSLPAAIGAYYSNGNPAFCISGDGSFQMNIQELQWISSNKLPIKSIVFNNGTLGLIRQQQDDLFDGRHYASDSHGGYYAPSFTEVARAYGIDAIQINAYTGLESPQTDLLAEKLAADDPAVIEVLLSPDTYAYPKTPFGTVMHNQFPYIDEKQYRKLLQI